MIFKHKNIKIFAIYCFLISVFKRVEYPLAISLVLSASIFHIERLLFASLSLYTVENYCDCYHKDIGTHVENEQTHCGVFNAQTPLYDAVTVNNHAAVFRIILSVYHVPKFLLISLKLILVFHFRGPLTC
ncbi:MAG TPA: hypothetical protein VKG26_13025 [Bacteroidia bacterium]|nr:hypothetical protein [Bacteroidia bacterium]